MSTNCLFLLMAAIIIEAIRNTYFNSQPQISPKYCLHHNMTLNDVTLLHCAYLCVRSNGCRVAAYTPTTRTCMGCQYFMDKNYTEEGFDDTIDVPVGIPADSILYTPDTTRYEYIGCYADCGPVYNDTLPCEKRALAQAYGPTSITNELCFEYCQTFGSRYFGTQGWIWCSCGLVYDKIGATDRCDTPCGGNTSQICGGYWANSVYEIIVRD